INFGRNFHGTGDISGYQYGISYNNYFSKRFFKTLAFEGTLNDKQGLLLVYEDPDGRTIDGTLNNVTGGFQLLGGLGFSFIRSQKHTAGISLSALARYQATSINDAQEVLYPALTDFPVPIRFIYNEERQRTLAVGGALKLFYTYQFKSNWLINLTGSFQQDTNGDTISAAMLGIGKAFN
ncbi:MAG: hypothetical protein WA951_09460, partial [Leeuwenhoekiella sp.]